MLETKVMFNATELTIKVSVWARGDPFPAIGHAVGIDTETELITDAELTPPLVVLGVFNPADMTCYQIAWTTVCHMCFTCLSAHRSPWRVSAIEQESELLGHLNG